MNGDYLPSMTEKQTDKWFEFSNLMGSIVSGEGMPRNSGRIIGYLIMSGKPIAFADLCGQLAISRGGGSENTRLLEELGIIQRVSLPGDRRDHFQIREDAGAALIEQARRRSSDNIQEITKFRKNADLLPFQHERLAAMESFIAAHLSTLTQERAPTGMRPSDKGQS